MLKIHLRGQNLSTLKAAEWTLTHLNCYEAKQLNLKLKTWFWQLLGSFLLDNDSLRWRFCPRGRCIKESKLEFFFSLNFCNFVFQTIWPVRLQCHHTQWRVQITDTEHSLRQTSTPTTINAAVLIPNHPLKHEQWWKTTHLASITFVIQKINLSVNKLSTSDLFITFYIVLFIVKSL